VLEWIEKVSVPPGRAVLLGGGGGTLARFLGGGDSPWELVVVERSEELIDLAHTHFRTWDGRGRVEWAVNEPLAWIDEDRAKADLVVVDAGSLPSLAGLPVLRQRGFFGLAELLSPEGLLVMGGLSGDGGPGGISRVARDGSAVFPKVALYQEVPGTEDRRMLPELGNRATFLLAASKREVGEWPLPLQGFLPLPITGE
jgi:spermidine synthase